MGGGGGDKEGDGFCETEKKVGHSGLFIEITNSAPTMKEKGQEAGEAALPLTWSSSGSEVEIRTGVEPVKVGGRGPPAAEEDLVPSV